MEDKTRTEINDLLDLLESNEYTVSELDVKEYALGDPTVDRRATGAEISLTAYVAFDYDGRDDENPFRVK